MSIVMSPPAFYNSSSGRIELGVLAETLQLPRRQVRRRAVATDGTVVNELCVDYELSGYFPGKNADLIAGVPSGYETLPSTISVCELELLHSHCVRQINKYRSGELTFSDGTSDSNVVGGLRALAESSGLNECTSQQAMGDLKFNVENGGGCAGSHRTAGTCPWRGAYAQNSCCARGGGSFGDDTAIVTYESAVAHLDDCLQQMWDEGITPGQKGHWQNMRRAVFSTARCGFAWSGNGRFFAIQDFGVGHPSGLCSCAGTNTTAGDADGCGGACVACTESASPVCADAPSRPRECDSIVRPDGRVRPLQCGSARIRAVCPLSCGACPVYNGTCPTEQGPATAAGSGRGATVEPPGAGAIVGVVVGVLILLLGGAFVWHRHRLRKAAEAKAAAEAQAAEAQAAEDAHPLSPIANWWGALWGGGGGGTADGGAQKRTSNGTAKV